MSHNSKQPEEQLRPGVIDSEPLKVLQKSVRFYPSLANYITLKDGKIVLSYRSLVFFFLSLKTFGKILSLKEDEL